MPPRRSKKNSAEGLLSALYFISTAQKNEAEIPYKTHCILHNQTVTAYDGTITVGCKISEELEVCPHTFKLIAALERTEKKDISITELEGRLSIKSGAFSVFVPCWHDPMPSLEPDQPLCAIDDRLRVGFEMISGFTVDNDKKRIVETSLLLRANSMVSTDGAAMLEFWHGISLPVCILPKPFVSAIINVSKKLKAFGYSQREIEGTMKGVSCTFWFEDDSWIKTQLYEENWPEIDKILNVASKPEPLPKGFYEALNKVEPFSNGKEAEKAVFFENGMLQSHRDKNEGACCEVEVKHGPAFNIKRLKRIQHCIETVDFYSHDAMYFFGAGVRGILMGVRR